MTTQPGPWHRTMAAIATPAHATTPRNIQNHSPAVPDDRDDSEPAERRSSDHSPKVDMAQGGIVRGPDGRADNTPAVLHPEDFPLIRLKDATTYGRAPLDAINHARPPSARQHDFEEERP